MNRLLAFAVLSAGCQYDYDKLYEHAAEGDGGIPLVSEQLISKWFDSMPLTQECVSCAESQCADQNTACMGDPQCVAYTECVGKDPNPAGLARCRKDFADWVNTMPHVRDRDLGGPYGQCVFRFKCSGACTADSDLWCAGKYSMPTTTEATVPLSLYLVDAYDQKSPVVNASVRACSAQNARECADSSAEAMGVTNADGLVRLQLPSSFSRAFTGYLEITGADRYPTLLKFSWRMGEPTTQVVSIVGELFFKLGLQGAGVTTDETRGMLQLRMLGCQGAGVKGVHYVIDKVDPGIRTWYIDGDLPKLDATETTWVGSGGIINIPEGSVNARALAADESVVAEVDAPVRAKYMTVVIYAPQGSN